MRRVMLRLGICIILGAVATAPDINAADQRPANLILAEIDGIPRPPRPDKATLRDKDASAEYVARLYEALERRRVLIRELWHSDPENSQLPRLLGETWNYGLERATERRNSVLKAMLNDGADLEHRREAHSRPWFAELRDEMNAVIAATKNERVKVEAVHWKAKVAVEEGLWALAKHLPPDVEAFIALAPKDERGAQLLYEVSRRSHDWDMQVVLLTRLIGDYPDSGWVSLAEHHLDTLAGVGHPFELVFNDAITGRNVQTRDLRGKVIVVEFWATWCGPCVAGMPKMKALYERFHEQGVEFVGISLDRPADGGLDRLKTFVAQHELPWPQLYLHEGGENQPASLRGSFNGGIPQVWLVDQEGRLSSIHARGKLETMIPDLLRKGQGTTRPKQ